MCILGCCIAFKLGGIHVITGFEFMIGGFKGCNLFTITLIAGALTRTATYFARASYLFYRGALKT